MHPSFFKALLDFFLLKGDPTHLCEYCPLLSILLPSLSEVHGSALYLYHRTTGHGSIKIVKYEERKNVNQCVTDCYDLNCYLMFKRHLTHVFYILDMTGWKYSRASGNPKYIDLL